MTVAVETPRIELAWTGAETEFPAGFSAGAVTDVDVSYKDADGVVTSLTPNIHVAVSIDGSGMVTVLPVAMPDAPGTVIVACSTPAEQTVNFALLPDYDAALAGRLHDAHVRRAREALFLIAQRLGKNTAADGWNAAGLPVKAAGAAVAGTDLATLGQVQALVAGVGTVAGPAGDNLFTALAESIKTGDYTITTGDRGKFILANKATAIEFALPAAAALATYVYFVGNIGDGLLTINPDGAEVVDAMLGGSATSIALARGEFAMLVGNGTLWRAFVTRREGARDAETSVASAATCDIGASPTEAVFVTGTTGIASFGSRPNRQRTVRFEGAVTLTHSSALALLGAADRTTIAGAIGVYRSDASGDWRELAYQEGDASVSAAGLRVRSEPTSRIGYRNGAGDIRDDVLGVNIFKRGNSFVEAAKEMRLAGELSLGGYNAPAQITADQDDYALPADVSIVALTTDDDWSITGFVAPDRRRVVWLLNANAAGGGVITIPQDSASSTAANRVLASGDADIVLHPGQGGLMVYSLAASRWRIARDVEIASASDIWTAKAGKLIDAKALAASQALIPLALAGGSCAVNLALGNNFELGITNAITTNVTLTNVTNGHNGQQGFIRFKQGSPARSISYAGGWCFPGAVKPALTNVAGRFDDLFYTVIDAGTALLSCSFAKDVRG